MLVDGTGNDGGSPYEREVAGSEPATPTTVDLLICRPLLFQEHWRKSRSGGLDLGAHSKVYRRGMSVTNASRPRLRVAELARSVGLTADTVRYYERAGLLPSPARTPSGYRAYGAEAAERLRFIQGCQRLGLRLRDIRDLLAIRDTGECPCEPAEQLLRRRLAELDAEAARLAALRADMVQMLEALPSADCLPPPGTSWCPPSERR